MPVTANVEEAAIKRPNFFKRPVKDIITASAPIIIFVALAALAIYKFVDPAPPKQFTISTGEGEGDYETYAKLYQDIIKDDGVDLKIAPSKGAWENLRRLSDPHSNIDAGFVQDGLGSQERSPDVSSLGSLYYEPIWIFYKGKTAITRLSQFTGKKIAVGEKGGSTHTMAMKLFRASGVDEKNATFLELAQDARIAALKSGQADAALFVTTPHDDIIVDLMKTKDVKLVSLDQAEAIVRQFPYLHHLVLPHGAFDLKGNVPDHDIDIVAPTATLLVKDSLHPALAYLLLKAMSQVHGDPGIFEKKNEFPVDKDYVFALSDDAKSFYKNGVPFWQKHLPFWLATLADRFIVLVIPLLALIIPVFKAIPRILSWRLRSRFFRHYGELRFLETQMAADTAGAKFKQYLEQLDRIEERVNRMKVPLDFTDHLYSLREHIHFVRKRLQWIADQAHAH